MMLRRAARWPLLLLSSLALLLGNDTLLRHDRPAPAPLPASLLLPLEVEVAGCGAVLAGHVCELPEVGSLRVWVKAPEDARLTATVDGNQIPIEGAPIQGGTRMQLHPPALARELVVTASRGQQERAERRWKLSPPRPDPALKEAEDLRQNGKLPEATARLEALLSDPDPARRARAQGKLARIASSRGQIDEAARRFEETIAAHLALGRISDAFLDSFAEAYALIYRGRRFAEARRVLDRLDPFVEAHPEGRVLRTYYAAVVSYETGDLRATLQRFRASVEGAERLGLEQQRLDTLQLMAVVLQELGRGAEGEAILREVREAFPEDASACSRAAMLTNAGWFAVQALAGGNRGGKRAEDAVDLLEQALALHRGPCPGRDELTNVLTNLSLAALYGDDLARARRYLDEARREQPDPDARIAVWLLDIEGRIALASHDATRARELYRRMAELAESGALPGSRVRAALGRAEALEALGRVPHAREAYAEAEALLGEQSLLVPLGEGRDSFLGQFEEGARKQVDFLLRDDVAKAASAARRSRARALSALRWRARIEALGPAEREQWERALSEYRREREALDMEARGDWKLAADALARAHARRQAREAQVEATLEHALAVLGRADAAEAHGALPPVDPGELLLVYHPIREGWAAFAVTGDGVTARELPRVNMNAPAADLARELFAPFEHLVEGARRIRLAPYGELAQVDFHALPWKGEPLLVHAPVTYAVDLPGRRNEAALPAEAGAPLALVVADPRRDLPAARREAEVVAAALAGAGGFRVARLSGEEATHGAVRSALELPGTRLFHYAGHGFFGGRDGWESGLPLARAGWLTVQDVLALARVPAQVVLSGCDTARTAPEARAAGLGLAQAFVVAGAASVIAATRPLDDRMAERLMGALYGASFGSGGIDAARSLREAVLAVRGEAPGADWASLRVLVP